ncbi:hypothetical protein [Thalassotalea agariperforans]
MSTVSFNTYNVAHFYSRHNDLHTNSLTENQKSKDDHKYQDSVSISVQARQREHITTQTVQDKNEENLYTLKYGDLNTYDNMTFLEKAHQAIMDNRMGLDRDKIEEINDKMEAIINDNAIPEDVKMNLLENLAKEKQAEYKKAADQTEEQAKLEDVRNIIEGKH